MISSVEAKMDTIAQVHIKEEPEDDTTMERQNTPIQTSPRTDGLEKVEGKGTTGPATAKNTKQHKTEEIRRLKEKRFQLMAELTGLQRKKGERKLTQKEVSDFKILRQKISGIQTDLEIDHSLTPEEIENGNLEYTTRQAPREGKRLETIPSTASSTESRPKRKSEGARENTVRAKKPKHDKKGGPKSREKGKKKQCEDRSAIVMCSMTSLAMEDSIQARAGMGELPTFLSLEASKVESHMKQLRQLAEKHPNADKKRINADMRALAQTKLSLRNKFRVEGEKWLIKGMKTALYHHQFFGAGWMVQRERSEVQPQGGLLADHMGLGKTLQVLACTVAHPPTKDDKNAKRTVTLIVAPANIIPQWENEIHKHCDELSISVYTRAQSKHRTVVDLCGSSILYEHRAQPTMGNSQLIALA